MTSNQNHPPTDDGPLVRTCIKYSNLTSGGTMETSIAATTPTTTNNDDPSFPRILTAAMIPSLTQGLDASSVLECYVLQRTAVVGGLAANSTLSIRKLALGVRYRPPPGMPSHYRQRREVTLEYGPLRQDSVGDLMQETMPRLVENDNNNNNQYHVDWNNEAHIYVTREIAASHYQSATLIATMTGAVLQNLLQTAVAYPVLSRRRYQPFSVYKKSTNELLLKSSSDLDFVQALWQHLADVGVELSPLILPNRWQLRLIASDIRRIRVSPNNAMDADHDGPTVFFSKLYNCLNAMVTANYSSYEHLKKGLRANRTKTNGKKRQRDGGRTLEELLSTLQQESESLHDDEPGNASTTSFSIVPQHTMQPTLSAAPTILQTVPPLDKDDAGQAAQDASEAAQDAQSAAEDAQHSGNQQAADAAQAAAQAAQKAANATHTQAASMSQTALLGGDGGIMVQTIAQCFQNPRYGLALTNTTAQAFVYFDGIYYYQVNLTTPYLQIIPVSTGMPEATHDNMVNDAEFVDYVLALVVMIFTMIGFLLLLQQVMGRNYHVIRPLYKFQHFLFDPMHYKQARTHDGNLLEDDSAGFDVQRLRDRSRAAGLNVIPLSMGGLKSSSSVFSKSKKNDDASESEGWEQGDGVEELDMEMVEGPMRLPPQDLNELAETEQKTLSRSSSFGTFHPHDIPLRMFRDPELVDLPTLTSSSKVAMPVSFGNGSQSSSINADEDA